MYPTATRHTAHTTVTRGGGRLSTFSAIFVSSHAPSAAAAATSKEKYGEPTHIAPMRTGTPTAALAILRAICLLMVSGTMLAAVVRAVDG